LFTDEVQAGRKVVAWNGMDERNLRLPNGVYVDKLTNGQLTMTKRLMVAK
jgi:hypothetical protein